MFGSTPQENFSSSRWIPRDEEKWGETLAIFKIPQDGEKGRGVVKSHEETESREISRQYMPMLLLLEDSHKLLGTYFAQLSLAQLKLLR